VIRATIIVTLFLLAASVDQAVAAFDPFAAIGLDSTEASVPRDLPFRDEHGRTVRIGDYFGKQPVIVAPVYYLCPNTCGTTLAWLFGSLDDLPQRPVRDYELVVFSIDPREGPADAAEAHVKASLRDSKLADAAGVHFLVGTEASIGALTRALGFRYRWDSNLQQYAHPVGIAVLSPQGRLSRWLYGFSYGSDELTAALGEAKGVPPKISFGQQLLLLCHFYNPITGKYTDDIWTAFRIAGALTVGGLIAVVAYCRRQRRTPRRGAVQ
jgi:protein SCO1/2